MIEYSFTKLVIVGSNPVDSTGSVDIAPVFSKEFLDI